MTKVEFLGRLTRKRLKSKLSWLLENKEMKYFFHIWFVGRDSLFINIFVMWLKVISYVIHGRERERSWRSEMSLLYTIAWILLWPSQTLELFSLTPLCFLEASLGSGSMETHMTKVYAPRVLPLFLTHLWSHIYI